MKISIFGWYPVKYKPMVTFFLAINIMAVLWLVKSAPIIATSHPPYMYCNCIREAWNLKQVHLFYVTSSLTDKVRRELVKKSVMKS